MARGEIVTARVERIAAGGAGIARVEGKSVFIALTAGGDTVRCRISNDHKNWAEAELLEVLEPSPQRTKPLCPHYGICGGCSLQHLNYEAQIEAKRAILGDAFIRLGGINPPEIRLHKSEAFGYRNRVQFHKADESGQKLMFKERKSSRLVVLEDCPVADRGIREALKNGGLNPPGRKRFTVYSRNNTFLYEGGPERGKVSILGRELTIDAGVFFQSNASMLELLIKDLLRAASGTDNSLPLADVYCGVGTFSSFLGGGFEGNQGFTEIDLIEENKTALTLARENVRALKVNYHPLTDTAWVKTLKEKGRSGPWSFMILDPPREGLSAPLREYLAHNGPALIAYVSCDPATLARDSRVLADGGYSLKELTMYDFYPQTAHIESLALFSR